MKINMKRFGRITLVVTILAGLSVASRFEVDARGVRESKAWSAYHRTVIAANQAKIRQEATNARLLTAWNKAATEQPPPRGCATFRVEKLNQLRLPTQGGSVAAYAAFAGVLAAVLVDPTLTAEDRRVFTRLHIYPNGTVEEVVRDLLSRESVVAGKLSFRTEAVLETALELDCR
jgi:hypothetical protein